MATFACDDDDDDGENLAETDEVSYENANMVDNEPFYKNFSSIQNDLRSYDEQKQFNMSLHSISKKYQTDRVQTEPFHFSERSDDEDDDDDDDDQNSPKTIDGHVSNLIQMVEDIGYDPQSTFIHPPFRNTTPTSISYDSDAVYESVAHSQPVQTEKQPFYRWYLDRYQRSASMNRYYPVNHIYEKATQKLDNYQSDIKDIQPSVTTDVIPKQMDEERFQKNVNRMYGFDDLETISSVSSRRSSIDRDTTPTFSDRTATPVLLETVDDVKPKQITIREYFPSKHLQAPQVSGSLSPSSQQTVDDNFYEQVIYNHPDVYQDPNPEIVSKPNPNQIVYKQNVSVRYLVPPTPPPPGPLIIREILQPRQPSPPPLIISQQEPTPSTPSPLILREIPPPPPPQVEAKVITKVVPQTSPPSQRVVVERHPPLPAKPQSIIIEKWLPYKPAPPREIIYERVVEAPSLSEFQPNMPPLNHELRNPNSIPRLPIPVHIEKPNPFDYPPNKQPSSTAFEHLARATQRQLEVLQQRVANQIQAQQQWLANQHQQHMNMRMQMPLTLTTPALVINHPPTTRTTNVYAQTENFQQDLFYPQSFMYPSCM